MSRAASTDWQTDTFLSVSTIHTLSILGVGWTVSTPCSVIKNCPHCHPELSILWVLPRDPNELPRLEHHVGALSASLPGLQTADSSSFPLTPLKSFLFQWWTLSLYSDLICPFVVSGHLVVSGVQHSARVDLTELPWKWSKLVNVLPHKRARIKQIALRPLETQAANRV